MQFYPLPRQTNQNRIKSNHFYLNRLPNLCRSFGSHRILKANKYQPYVRIRCLNLKKKPQTNKKLIKDLLWKRLSIR